MVPFGKQNVLCAEDGSAALRLFDSIFPDFYARSSRRCWGEVLVRDRGGAVFPNIIKGPSRRSLLQGVGCAIAVSPSVAFAAANPVSPAMAKLSAYMSDAGDRALPDDVVEKAKHHLLDTFAAMVSGSDLPPARAAYMFASSYTHDTVSG